MHRTLDHMEFTKVKPAEKRKELEVSYANASQFKYC